MNFLSRSFCGLFLLVCAAMGAGAQGVGSLAGEKLPVVPYPAEIVAGNEDFCVADRQCVNVSSKEAEDVFAVSTFTSDFNHKECGAEARCLKQGGLCVVCRQGRCCH